MKKVILGIIVIAVAVLAVACGSKSTPKAIATKYVTAIQKGDKEAAADCFYYNGTDEENAKKRADRISLIEKSIKSLEDKGGIKSFSVTNVEENGDKAVVHGKVTYGNGEVDEDERIPTMKIDDKWYIDTNK